ncbi:hypothetical protein A6U87_27730 [Rhizobium sp. AC44/96]|nr:hypothetical protein A6U87_27730 [Rhizobium sp. AC44/96]
MMDNLGILHLSGRGQADDLKRLVSRQDASTLRLRVRKKLSDLGLLEDEGKPWNDGGCAGQSEASNRVSTSG